jgi:hypothetical protein
MAQRFGLYADLSVDENMNFTSASARGRASCSDPCATGMEPLHPGRAGLSPAA